MPKKYYKYSDTRQSRRVSSSFLIKCGLIERGDVPPIVTTTKDISGAGVSFIAKEPFSISSRVELEIGFPATPYPIKAIGKIVRIEQAGEHQIYKVAVHFLKMNEEDRQAIEDYVKQAAGRRPQRKSWWRKFT